MTLRSFNFLYYAAWPQTNKVQPIKVTWYLKLSDSPHKCMRYTHYC